MCLVNATFFGELQNFASFLHISPVSNGKIRIFRFEVGALEVALHMSVAPSDGSLRGLVKQTQ